MKSNRVEPKPHLIGSSPSLERLTALITDYYCGTKVVIRDGQVFNSRGAIAGVRVVEARGRYLFQAAEVAA